MIKKYRRKIERKKALLNFLLNYLSISNKIILYISQDLDNLIIKDQKFIYKRYSRKNFRKNILKKAA